MQQLFSLFGYVWNMLSLPAAAVKSLICKYVYFNDVYKLHVSFSNHGVEFLHLVMCVFVYLDSFVGTVRVVLG